MKYFLKDKNGIVHTESQNSFKMAFKHHHIIDKTTDEGGIAGYFNISYPNEGHNEHLGKWSFGIPAINDVCEGTASTYWRTRATNNFITPIDLVVNDNDLIHKSNIKNKIIIKYDTKTNEIPTGWELYSQTSEEHSSNGILTLKNIHDNNNNTYNIGYLINMNEQSSPSYWNWGVAENYQVNTRAAHTVYNNNKYYQEHTFSNSERYKTNYFTIKKSDWNNYTKIRIRVRLVFNNFYDSSDPEHSLGKIKNSPSGNVSEYLRPVILVARTSNKTELTDANDFGLKSDGTREYHGLSFLYGDNKKDTFCSLDDATETRENRGRLNSYKDFMTYEHLSEENYYYTYTYTPYTNTTLGGTPTRIYEISKDEVYNYLNMDNPPFRIMTFDDYNNTDLQTNINRGVDIKDLNTYLAPKLGNDWYKKALDKTNLSYPIKFKEGWWYEYENISHITITKYSYSDTNSFYADGYYDINVSELKDYLHICFPYITTCGGYTYTYRLYSFLEMSIEGVN